VYGQSLGAAVALQLAATLGSPGAQGTAASAGVQAEGVSLSGLILDAPFFSASSAAVRHPLYRLLTFVPLLRKALLEALVDRWESGEVIKHLRCPILIFGAGQDGVVGPDGAVQLLHAAAEAQRDATSPRLVMIDEGFHTNVYSYSDWLAALAEFTAWPGTNSKAGHRADWLAQPSPAESSAQALQRVKEKNNKYHML